MARNKNESASPPGTVAQVKERPILFNGAMVRAILSGEKTQTRRPYKVRRHPDLGCEMAASELVREAQHAIDRACPYGQPGERLWVRESGVRSKLAGLSDQPGLFRHDVPATQDIGYYWVERTRARGAGYSVPECTREAALRSPSAKACPSIHMPRWASRILLEITEVRVERLQAITEGDARAEGTDPMDVGGLSEAESALLCGPLKEAESPYRNGYALLWDSINGVGDWDRNPWVWVVCFRRIDTGEHTQIKAEMEHAE